MNINPMLTLHIPACKLQRINLYSKTVIFSVNAIEKTKTDLACKNHQHNGRSYVLRSQNSNNKSYLETADLTRQHHKKTKTTNLTIKHHQSKKILRINTTHQQQISLISITENPLLPVNTNIRSYP